jgi:hypothetical protein
MHIPIDTAPFGKIAGKRRDVAVHGIVQLDGNHIVSADHDVGSHVKNKGRESALMLTQKSSIHPHIRHQKSTVKFEKEVKSRIGARHGKVASIPTGALVVSRAGTILPIGNIPSVRQIQVRPGRIIEANVLRICNVLLEKPPVGIQSNILAAAGGRNIGLRRHQKRTADTAHRQQRQNSKLLHKCAAAQAMRIKQHRRAKFDEGQSSNTISCVW